MNIIEQRFRGDCVVCTIAMATNRSYDEIFDLLPKDVADNIKTYGIDTIAEMEILCKLGWDPVLCFSFPHLGPCLVTVASLNYYGTLHSVYYDGQTVFDPSVQKKHDINSVIKANAFSLMNKSAYSEEVIQYEKSLGMR